MHTSDASPPRPDLTAHTNAIRLPVPSLVEELRTMLGAKLVAYIGGVQETRAVRQWSEGTRKLSNDDVLQRLRIAYQAAHLLAERDHPAAIQAWFQGLNPSLGDRAPAKLLRAGDIDDVGPQIISAARMFAATS